MGICGQKLAQRDTFEPGVSRLDEIPSVVHAYVIRLRRPPFFVRRVRSSLNAKIGLASLDFSAAATSVSAGTASNLYSASISGHRICVRAKKDRLDLQVVVMIFCYLQGEEVSSKESGIPSAQAHARILTTRSPLVSASRLRHGRTGSHDFFTNHACRSVYGQERDILPNPLNSTRFCVIWCSDECAFAAMILDKTATPQVLNSPTNGNPAEPRIAK